MSSVNRRNFIITGVGAASTLGRPAMSQAQAPIETLKIAVGYPAGGTTDLVARYIGERLRAVGYARNVVIENRAGANGRLVLETLKSAPSDGSAAVVAPSSAMTINPHIYAKLSYRPFEDMVPISTVATFDATLAVGPMVPASVKNLRDFLAWCKSNPASAAFGSPGVGSSLHLLVSMFAKTAGVDLTHVAFRGSIPAVTDLVGGHIAAVTLPIGDFLPHMKTGKVRLLAVSGPERSRFVPDVATYQEQGFRDIVAREGWDVLLPATASPAIVASLARACNIAAADPAYAESLAALAIDAKVTTQEATVRTLKEQSQRWAERVRATGITAES
jgi:tripartite-type tricarboxylate transporter receptor subunit TctC